MYIYTLVPIGGGGLKTLHLCSLRTSWFEHYVAEMATVLAAQLAVIHRFTCMLYTGKGRKRKREPKSHTQPAAAAMAAATTEEPNVKKRATLPKHPSPVVFVPPSLDILSMNFVAIDRPLRPLIAQRSHAASLITTTVAAAAAAAAPVKPTKPNAAHSQQLPNKHHRRRPILSIPLTAKVKSTTTLNDILADVSLRALDDMSTPPTPESWNNAAFSDFLTELSACGVDAHNGGDFGGDGAQRVMFTDTPALRVTTQSPFGEATVAPRRWKMATFRFILPLRFHNDVPDKQTSQSDTPPQPLPSVLPTAIAAAATATTTRTRTSAGARTPKSSGVRLCTPLVAYASKKQTPLTAVPGFHMPFLLPHCNLVGRSGLGAPDISHLIVSAMNAFPEHSFTSFADQRKISNLAIIARLKGGGVLTLPSNAEPERQRILCAMQPGPHRFALTSDENGGDLEWIANRALSTCVGCRKGFRAREITRDACIDAADAVGHLYVRFYERNCVHALRYCKKCVEGYYVANTTHQMDSLDSSICRLCVDTDGGADVCGFTTTTVLVPATAEVAQKSPHINCFVVPCRACLLHRRPLYTTYKIDDVTKRTAARIYAASLAQTPLPIDTSAVRRGICWLCKGTNSGRVLTRDGCDCADPAPVHRKCAKTFSSILENKCDRCLSTNGRWRRTEARKI
jgi:hypothetical protein